MGTDSIEAQYETVAQLNQIVERRCNALADSHTDLAQYHQLRADLFGAKADPARYRELVAQYESMRDEYGSLQGEYERLASYYQGGTPRRQAIEKLWSECDSMRQETLASIDKYSDKVQRLSEKSSSSIFSHVNWMEDHAVTAKNWTKAARVHAAWRNEASRNSAPQLGMSDSSAGGRGDGAGGPHTGAVSHGRAGTGPSRGASGIGPRPAGRGGGIQRVNAEGVIQSLGALRSSQNKLQAQTDQLSKLQGKFNQVSSGSAAESVTEAVGRVINHQRRTNQSIIQVVKATEKYVGNVLKIDSLRF